MICHDCTENDATTPAIGCCVHCGGTTCKSQTAGEEFGVFDARRAGRQPGGRAVMCARCGAAQVAAPERVPVGNLRRR